VSRQRASESSSTAQKVKDPSFPHDALCIQQAAHSQIGPGRNTTPHDGAQAKNHKQATWHFLHSRKLVIRLRHHRHHPQMRRGGTNPSAACRPSHPVSVQVTFAIF
jgi:hypothetical protein